MKILAMVVKRIKNKKKTKKKFFRFFSSRFPRTHSPADVGAAGKQLPCRRKVDSYGDSYGGTTGNLNLRQVTIILSV